MQNWAPQHNRNCKAVSVNWVKLLRWKGFPALHRFGWTIHSSQAHYCSISLQCSIWNHLTRSTVEMCNMWIFKAELSDSEAQQSVNLRAGPGLVSLLIPETPGVFLSLNILLHSQNSGQTDPSLHKPPPFIPKDTTGVKFFCLPNLHLKQSIPHNEKRWKIGTKHPEFPSFPPVGAPERTLHLLNIS